MWHKAALEAGPDHVPAHLSYGKWLAKNVSYGHHYFIYLFFFRPDDGAPPGLNAMFIFLFTTDNNRGLAINRARGPSRRII